MGIELDLELELETERLRLVKWDPVRHEAGFTQMNHDQAVLQYLPGPWTDDEWARLVACPGVFILEDKEQEKGSLVGVVGLIQTKVENDLVPAGSYEVFWRIKPDFWGQGLTSEAAMALLGQAFHQLGLEQVFAFGIVENTASLRVMEKIGMKRTGEFHHPKLPREHPLCLHQVYAIDKTTHFWLSKWHQNQIGFHRDTPHHFLPEYFKRELPAGGRVLVPLCGKSLDMVWLKEHGQAVVGVEFSQKAIDDFYQEQAITPGNSSITLLQRDFFEVRPEEVGDIDVVYDRAALIAIHPSLRPDYIKKLRELAPNGTYCITTLSYPEELGFSGPPFSVGKADMDFLFGGGEGEDAGEGGEYEVTCVADELVEDVPPALKSEQTELEQKIRQLAFVITQR
jgi:thiopurine S-methyltransferase